MSSQVDSSVLVEEEMKVFLHCTVICKAMYMIIYEICAIFNT